MVRIFLQVYLGKERESCFAVQASIKNFLVLNSFTVSKVTSVLPDNEFLIQ